MGTTATLAQNWLRNYITNNVPSSGEQNPIKADGIATLTDADNRLSNLESVATTSASAGFTTLALLNANLAYPANSIGVVFQDGTPANDGNYLKSGVSSQVTATIASPSVFTMASGNAPANTTHCTLSSTGTLPTGFAAGTVYFVVSSSGSNFSLAATSGGTPITGTGSQTGTITAGFGSWTQVSPLTFAAANLTGTTLASNVVTSSLTSVGTLAGLTVSADASINGLTVGLGNGAVATNVVLGQGAFASNVSGQANICIGRDTLQNNTSGSFSIAIGDGALQGAAGNTAFQNLAIGAGNLANVQTGGIQNIAIGLGGTIGGTGAVLGANTTGFSNLAIGISTLAANISGSSNIALGPCMGQNTTGSSNLAVGGSALNQNTVGGFNVALGQMSLQNNQQGSFNTAAGVNSLINIATFSSGALSVVSSFNTAFGANALFDLGFPSITGATVTIGNSYTIFSIGTTNWVAAGAASNTIGQTFTATATTTGTGLAFANVSTNNNSALGYNTGRGIVFGINNTILGANVTGLAAGLSNSIILGTGQGTIRADFGKTNAATWTFASPVALPSSTVAALPAAGIAGRTAYANNLRAFNGAGTQQGAGVGTGGLVIDNGTRWVNADAQSVTAIA